MLSKNLICWLGLFVWKQLWEIYIAAANQVILQLGLSGEAENMKTKLLVFVLAVILSLSLVNFSPVFSQAENTIKVLSYSWYTRSSDGDFIVVGEVQNQGDFIVNTVSLTGTVYTKDGTSVASSSIDVYGNYLLPQTKAPFYMDFSPQSSSTGDLSWNASVDHVEFSISNALPDSNREYENLSLIGTYGGVLNGVYMVSGFVLNNGNKTADDVRVVGTFYDNTARVVAVGFDVLNESVGPNDAKGFSIIEFDATPSLVSEISNYSLLVQTSTLADTSGSSSTSSSSPTPNNGNATAGSFPFTYVVAIVVIVVVIVAVVFALFVRRRRSRPQSRDVTQKYEPPPPPPPPPPTNI